MSKISVRILRNSAPLGMVVSAVTNDADLGDSASLRISAKKTDDNIKRIRSTKMQLINEETDSRMNKIRIAHRRKQIRSRRLRLRASLLEQKKLKENQL